MDKNNWKIDDDGIYLNSITNRNIPWLETSLGSWVDLEDKQNWFSKNQLNAFEEFKSLPNSNRCNLEFELEKLYINQLHENKILKIKFTNIFETIDWKTTQICIPQHYQSENNYVLLLPETKWKISDCDFALELELLFTNGKVELCQEMSGLWSRTEWFEDYIKRKKL